VTGPAVEIIPAASWATQVAAELAERLRETPGLRICLPTGETPGPFYDAVAALDAAGNVTFADATLVLLDEYVGLPSGDPARCDAQIRERLVGRLATPPAAFHVIEVDALAPEAAAAAIDAVAARGLDLAILGLGINGHIGMNEPGSTDASPTRVVALEAPTRQVAVERYGARVTPVAGITIGMDRLLAAGELWLLVTGARKAEVLDRTLHGPVGPDCPGSYLRAHPRLTVFADDAAAARLPVSR